MATILQTRLLGEVRAETHDGVSQFLGIQYATLKDRFADAELIEQREGSILDASKDGPTALSPSFGCDFELGHIQHILPKKELPQSDLNCLNLNITVPAGTTATSKLPVFLFIHGGGLVLGANSWPQFDYARFVKLSVEKNLPIVAVSMNYRLGAFGFLTSNELRRAGYNANNGLRDQKVAMRWVQKHIADFGGDPDNVTLAGMSAGGACVTYHLDSDEQLFKRAIVMSGTCLLIQPLPYDLHEQNYQQAIAALGLANASSEERIRALLETPGDDLVAKIPPTFLAAPAIDRAMVTSVVTYAQVADKGSDIPRGKKWCEDLMIGDAQMDASIMAFLMSHTKKDCASKFITAIYTILSSKLDVAQQILDKYNITRDMTDDEAFPAILNYVNDIAFFAPVLTFAKGWKNNVYVYHFNEGNPWDGPWKDRASHILDLAYLFQNFREFMGPDQQQLAINFAEDFFKFCHGVKPWPSVAHNDVEAGFTARVYGPAPNVGQVNGPYNEGSLRRSVLFDHADQASLDEFAQVLALFRTL
ncbi:putative carboxylesterase [Aspergillus fischeri NRRL 181]|uniref:Carboxylic ester hydrolase n=1 Tax=Neosartorya fischeri (strain ATCC 1020 / DSM 3700 / CBS 544.65 / FGSC A1164 / JCM 1740 / NRRL 181 / WB 181) TaxID=331117 RepID=A1DND5_NEOFI|nr:carboxylesterase, putative [Aspergillus fischeri NRRL 181]EAW16306.1 carboxylesterase, putative [Aspergillus fischeri NRRL 181]